MTLDEKIKELEKAKKNLEVQTGCFKNVLADRANMSERDYESYCEEMQGALEREEKAEKALGYY